MKLFTLSAALLLSGLIHAQHTNIQISTLDNPNEISIALNENNPSEMIAGANIASIYTSVNGGVSWSRIVQKSSYGAWGDPVVAIDSKGNYFHFHLSKPENGSYIDRIVCQKSIDKGLTFNNGSYAGLNGTKAQDKPWFAFDTIRQNIYLSWTQFDKYDSEDLEDRSNILFSKSADYGDSWSEAVQINSVDGDCLDDDNTVEGAAPAVAPNGDLFVCWMGPNGLVFNQSKDGGNTWFDREQKIFDIPGGWSYGISGIYRANGFPIMKIDNSGGKNNGTIYINWSDQRNGENDTDIWLTKSKDEGKTWSDPTRVNQDKTARQQFFTWMDIDQTNGKLYVVYHDRRNYDSDSTDVYMSYSNDGGESFKDVELSESAFLPDSSVFFGDYNNVAAHNGLIRPTWTRLDGTKLSVWTAIVDSDLLDNPENINLTVFYDKSGINLTTAKKIQGSVTIESIDGLWNKQWQNVKLTSNGKLFKTLNVLKPGIYSVTVRCEKEIYKRNFVVKE
ncbi:exo-alpha-sialidase [Cryomorpha ignava]|uniref:Exo-alpha-sialidase n=1 Tax=Cryomorpha ignava TaxID=101383 RepID=A0A7K3WUU4_9FLAO|nr:sialidase family protein [Cryomorpha ignava]NEN24435.1 exo-alpha-sialidase [Cryomorpha ignava]